MQRSGSILRVEVKMKATNLANKQRDITGKHAVKIVMNYAQTWK
jgi:hypothetical protein